ncbi:MAG: hypothetical protein ISS18_05800 [Bacteroidales bacterium]|nr:hypothetical protein [Bacteroidales bacterium]
MKTPGYFIIGLIVFPFIIQLNAQGVDKNYDTQAKTKQTNTQSTSAVITTTSESGSTSGSGYFVLNPELGKESGIFLYEEWKPGVVILKDKTVISDRLLRYNIYSQQMQFIYKGDTLAFARPEEIESLDIDNTKFIFSNFQYDNKPVNGYMEVLIEGDCMLLLFRRIAYRYIGDDTDTEQTEKYFLEEKYYIRKGDAPLTELPQTKKDIIEILSDKDADYMTYIKENKLKITQEEDLKELISYYNSL